MEEKIRNIIIIGSGPAGLCAALYNARADLQPLVFAGVKWGGQLMLTTEVENYPGFVDGILGPELMKKFRDQAVRFGAEVIDDDATAVDFAKRPFEVFVGNPPPQGSAEVYRAKSIIIATGAGTNWLGLANEQKLIGRGVSSCAPCDAWFFRDKKVVVVGGGDSAMEEALTLTKFASDVTIIHRRDEFRASKIMFDRARANKKISFITNSVIVDIIGEEKVMGIKIQNVVDKKFRELLVDGIFVAIGHSPMTDIFKGQVELDEKGFVKRVSNTKPFDKLRVNSTNAKQLRDTSKVGSDSFEVDKPSTFQMMTSVEGVFVAGDVHDYHYKQAVTAAGYGCAAALEVEKWLETQV